MKKGTVTLIILIAVVALIVLGGIGSYNGLVKSRESVDKSYSNIETQLQRRLDLIPNIVNTVKGYTDHEESVLKNVTDARAKLAGASTVGEQAEANEELTTAISRLLVVIENYPDLKANTQFTALTDELAGTENRIAVARTDYNKVVSEYNVKIKKFPTVIIARLFGFDAKDYFNASEAAQNAPVVDFG